MEDAFTRQEGDARQDFTTLRDEVGHKIQPPPWADPRPVSHTPDQEQEQRRVFSPSHYPWGADWWPWTAFWKRPPGIPRISMNHKLLILPLLSEPHNFSLLLVVLPLWFIIYWKKNIIFVIMFNTRSHTSLRFYRNWSELCLFGVGFFKGWLGLWFCVFLFLSSGFCLVLALVACVCYCLFFFVFFCCLFFVLFFVCLEFQIIRFVISTFTQIFFI